LPDRSGEPALPPVRKELLDMRISLRDMTGLTIAFCVLMAGWMLRLAPYLAQA